MVPACTSTWASWCKGLSTQRAFRAQGFKVRLRSVRLGSCIMRCGDLGFVEGSWHIALSMSIRFGALRPLLGNILVFRLTTYLFSLLEPLSKNLRLAASYSSGAVGRMEGLRALGQRRGV